jgi:D-3-phosphoglycerate dehydrogenase / 2-oxoglutarate reductase
MTLPNKIALIAAPVHPVLTDFLKNAGYEYRVHTNITQQQAPELIRDCTGVITSTRLQLDKALIDSAPALQWIGRMGSGMEVIDVDYAAIRGIHCFGSPEGNSNAVAEHALGMLLSLTHNITCSNNEVIRGLWRREENRGVELEGKTIGIIGFGNTGCAFAKKLAPFHMRILAYDKYRQDNIAPPFEHCASLQPIFDEADIVSFHVPQQHDTLHYCDELFVQSMKKPFTLINTSRGKVVSIKALYAGIQNGKIKGACLDVFEEEPPSQLPPPLKSLFDEMLQRHNVIVTPHIAGYTHEALYKMSKILVDKIGLVL